LGGLSLGRTQQLDDGAEVGHSGADELSVLLGRPFVDLQQVDGPKLDRKVPDLPPPATTGSSSSSGATRSCVQRAVAHEGGRVDEQISQLASQCLELIQASLNTRVGLGQFLRRIGPGRGAQVFAYLGDQLEYALVLLAERGDGSDRSSGVVELETSLRRKPIDRAGFVAGVPRARTPSSPSAPAARAPTRHSWCFGIGPQG